MQAAPKLLDTPLKIIGAIGAVISLVLGANQVTRVLSEVGERQRQVAEMQAIAAQQVKSADYPAAWSSIEKAITASDQGSYLAKMTGRLDEVRLDLRAVQEDLAMTWLQHVSVPSGSTFASIVDPLLAVVTRGIVASEGTRTADLLAHAGWAYFLKSRDGSSSGDPEKAYRQAIEIESNNPFARANWGHLVMWRRGSFEEAARHFSLALMAGRERPYVRRLQLAALRLYASIEAERGLLLAVNDMRKAGEPIDGGTRRAVLSVYFGAFNADESLQRVVATLPPHEHLDTMRALFFAGDVDTARVPLRDAMVALLQEAAGERAEAIVTWRAVRVATASGGDRRVATRAAAAIARLSAPGRG